MAVPGLLKAADDMRKERWAPFVDDPWLADLSETPGVMSLGGPLKDEATSR